MSSNGPQIQIPQAQLSDAGTYAISGFLPGTCPILPDTIDIIVNANPGAPNILTNGPVCAGDSLIFFTNTNAAQYFWTLGSTTSNQDSLAVVVNPGLYNAQLSIIDTNGCASPPNTITSAVFANPTINYTGPTSVCGPIVNFNATIGLDPQDPLNQLVWMQNNQAIGTGNPYAFDLQSNNGSMETFTVAITSDLGCTASDTFQVSFHPYPSVAFEVNPLCDGQTVNFTNQSTWTGTPINGTSIQATFQPGDGQTLNNISSSYTYNQSGTYPASLILESSAGCSDTSTQTFQLVAVPQITLNSQDTCGQVATFQALFDVQATAIQNFEWTINNESYNQNPLTLTFGQAGNIPYTFTLNLTNSCSYSSSGTIAIIPSVTLQSLIFPNIISTQSNSANHQWKIDSLYENCASFELKILNRWGQVIFSTNSAQKAFEGINDNGETLPEGIYFYLFTSGEEKRQGFIHVVH